MSFIAEHAAAGIVEHLQERGLPLPPLDAVYRASTMCFSETVVFAECELVELGGGRGRWRLVSSSVTNLSVLEVEGSLELVAAQGFDPDATYTANWSRPLLPVRQLSCGPGLWLPRDTEAGRKYVGVHWVLEWDDVSVPLPFSDRGRASWQVVEAAHRVVNFVQQKWDAADDSSSS